jgi:hypothetical protein
MNKGFSNEMAEVVAAWKYWLVSPAGTVRHRLQQVCGAPQKTLHPRLWLVQSVTRYGMGHAHQHIAIQRFSLTSDAGCWFTSSPVPMLGLSWQALNRRADE